jgi:hypothetical protein
MLRLGNCRGPWPHGFRSFRFRIADFSERFSTVSPPPSQSPGLQKIDSEGPFIENWDFLGTTGKSKRPDVAASVFSEAPEQRKSQDIFEKLYDSILQNKDKGTASQASGNKKQLTSTLQALFQQTDKADVELSKEDVTKIPLSMGFKTSKTVELIRLQLASSAQRQLVENKLSPIMQHLNQMETDYDITNYFENVVLPAFDANATIANQTVVSVHNPPVTWQSLPIILTKCIDILANDFSSPAGAIALYEITKRRDVEVYAAGCTVEVYNSILRLRWDYYRDIYAVRSVVAEMAVNAVFPDRYTIQILGDIIRDSIDAKYGIVGICNVPLWTSEEEAIVEELKRYRISFTNRLTLA